MLRKLEPAEPELVLVVDDVPYFTSLRALIKNVFSDTITAYTFDFNAFGALTCFCHIFHLILILKQKHIGDAAK